MPILETIKKVPYMHRAYFQKMMLGLKVLRKSFFYGTAPKIWHLLSHLPVELGPS